MICGQGKKSAATGSNGPEVINCANLFAEQDELFGVGDMDALLIDEPLVADGDLAPSPEPASPDQNNTASDHNNAGGSN